MSDFGSDSNSDTNRDFNGDINRDRNDPGRDGGAWDEAPRTDDHGTEGSGHVLVRQQEWPADGPAELELGAEFARVRVHLRDNDEAGEVRVEVRHDPSAGNAWTQGIAGLLSWLGNASGGAQPGGDLDELAAQAVAAVEISWSEGSRRLVVRSSQQLPLRVAPLAITVWAPSRSRLGARIGSGEVRVTGPAGWAGVRTGSGGVTLDGVDGDADVTTGSGDIDLGPVRGRARLRTGSGSVRLAGTGGHTEIKTGSGDVTLGAVAGDLVLRTGSGDVAVNDVHSGALQLTTGSGALRVGVHPGVAAELDLTSGSGRARSELEVAGGAPPQGAAVQIRGRTGSGDVLVARAVVPV